MLDLSRNALTGALSNTVPDTLEILDASENRLSSGLGDWLGKGRLAEVILAENDFGGELPRRLCNAHTVRVDLSGNAPRGALPESIEECVKLETLKIGGVGGGFGGGGGASLPSAGAFEKLARLTELSLPGFGLVGAIPTSVFAISKLRVLNLADNQLSGTIPAVSSTSLVEIRLDGNALEGDVPLSLLTLPELTALFLSENRLTGMEAPAANDTTFATEVTEIHLGGNRLTSIPEVLRNVTELESLNLSRNDIAGPVRAARSVLETPRAGPQRESSLGFPRGLVGRPSRAPRLGGFARRRERRHRGSLSAASIRSLARLKTLNLTGVGRFGAFPIAAGTPDLGLVSLVNLIAANAGFTGRLPPRMFDALPNLVHLDLRGNALEGSVPADVAPAEDSLVENFWSERSSPGARVLTHAALRCLLLSENAFSGVFPRLDAPAYHLATSFSSTGSDASTLLGVVDFSDAGRFDCPLPDRSVVYDTASCACAAGRAGPDDGRYECDDCPPGSFSNLESSEACAPCAAGEVSASPGASSSRRRVSSRNAAPAGSATCAKCAAGTFASTSRAGACDACPPGEHQPVEGETSCVKCAAGSSASTPGSATCAFCPAGAFSSAAGSTTCESCPAGTWQNATGQTACADCPAGTANAAEGANEVAACAPCPPGTSTGGDRAAAACEPCAARNVRGTDTGRGTVRAGADGTPRRERRRRRAGEVPGGARTAPNARRRGVSTVPRESVSRRFFRFPRGRGGRGGRGGGGDGG